MCYFRPLSLAGLTSAFDSLYICRASNRCHTITQILIEIADLLNMRFAVFHTYFATLCGDSILIGVRPPVDILASTLAETANW